jgi:hypothetical protein
MSQPQFCAYIWFIGAKDALKWRMNIMGCRINY